MVRVEVRTGLLVEAPVEVRVEVILGFWVEATVVVAVACAFWTLAFGGCLAITGQEQYQQRVEVCLGVLVEALGEVRAEVLIGVSG